MAIKTLALLIFCFNPILSHAQSFVMSLHTDFNYSKLHSKSSFHLFSDGQYVLETNTGVLGICTSPEIGRFVGKINPKQIEEMKNSLQKLSSLCNGIPTSSCTNDSKKIGIENSWRLSDLTGKNKINYYFKNDEKTPKTIREIVKHITSMQEKSKIGLTITKLKNNLFKFSYSGEMPIALPLSSKNVFIINKGGLIQLASDVFKNFHLDEQKITLSPGDSKEIKLNLGDPNAIKGAKLIYDSSSGENPIGHSEIQLSPCVQL